MNNKNPKTLILIDGNALAHRAYHAIPPLSAQGKLVHAVFGFTSILLRIMKEFEPEYIACTFDMAAPTFRHEKYKDYKATRVKADQDFYDQMPDIKAVVSAFTIPIYEKEGYEADDVIGTINKQALEEATKQKIALEVIIVTGDLDTLQLVSDKTKIYTMRKSIKDTVLYDISKVQERFGLTPEQMNDFKGLKGDPSDNIPGVAGIGEKTASALISKYDTLEKLYAAIEELDEIGATKTKDISASVFKKLLGSKDQAFFSRELSTINIDTPIQFELKGAETSTYNRQDVEEIFKKYNFFSLIKRLPESSSVIPAKAGIQSPTSETQEILSQIAELEKQEIFSEGIARLEREIIPVLQQMQENGIKIDIKRLEKLSEKFSKELADLEKKIYKQAGEEFNINSPQQLSEILFEKLKLPIAGLKKTPGKVISTAAAELEKLHDKHPIIDLISQYRELAKLKSTYVDALPKLADAHQRIHTTFHQLGTTTGRLSSSNPNIQNIPIKTENGREVRRAFIAEKGYKILKADYSQLELRIVASMAEDKKMLHIFQQGGDIHRATAAEVAEIPIEDVSNELRSAAKALNFGVIYGMGARGFAASAGISQEKAQSFITAYMEDFDEVAAYMERTKEFARKHGFVQTLFGRRRYIPELQSTLPHIQKSGERMAINMPIQGTAADLVKMAMLKASKELAPEIQKGDLRILLQIHDELVFEIKENNIKILVPKIKDIMENIYKLSAKLVVDVKIGDNWQDVE